MNTLTDSDHIFRDMAGRELSHSEVDFARAKASKVVDAHHKCKRTSKPHGRLTVEPPGAAFRRGRGGGWRREAIISKSDLDSDQMQV